MATTRFFADDLIEFSASTYRALGVSNKDSSLLVETLSQLDLRGHQSLGVMRTFGLPSTCGRQLHGFRRNQNW